MGIGAIIRGAKTYSELDTEGVHVGGPEVSARVARFKTVVAPRLTGGVVTALTGVGVLPHDPALGTAMLAAGLARIPLSVFEPSAAHPLRQSLQRLGLALTATVPVAVSGVGLGGIPEAVLVGGSSLYVLGTARTGVRRVLAARSDPVMDSVQPTPRA